LQLHVRLQVANFHQELKQVENKIVYRYFQTPANLRRVKDQTIEKLSKFALTGDEQLWIKLNEVTSPGESATVWMS
jgi:hypothetical protein